MIRLVNANEIAGTTHEYIGEEAIAVGVCSILNETESSPALIVDMATSSPKAGT